MRKATRSLNNEDGMATLEAVSLIVIFLVLVAYMLGSWGIVHTGITNSIAARNYAFETFRHRTNLTYLRDNTQSTVHYDGAGARTHGIMAEDHVLNGPFQATARPISLGLIAAQANYTNQTMHTQTIPNGVVEGQQIKGNIEASPVWVMAQYGMCLSAACGDQ